VAEAAKEATASTPVGSSSTAPTNDCVAAKNPQDEEVADSAEPDRMVRNDAAPATGHGTAAAVEDAPPTAEQSPTSGKDTMPPGQDQTATIAGGSITGLSPDAEAEAIKRMDEVVNALPPIPLKFLVLAFLSQHDWKQSKAPGTVEPEKIQEQMQTQAPAGTSSSVSTRKNHR
jgi:hypothetical protein